jgi:hypothetical protein
MATAALRSEEWRLRGGLENFRGAAEQGDVCDLPSATLSLDRPTKGRLQFIRPD